MPELLLELLSEEIPARMQKRATEDLKRLIRESLEKDKFEFSSIKTYSTPRRIVLVVNDLPLNIPDKIEEKRGPRSDAPDKAVDGFSKANKISRHDLEIKTTDKGDFYFAVIETKGINTAEFVRFIVGEAVFNLAWPKSMKWGNSDLTWVRQLHNILVIFDGKLVKDGIQLGTWDKIPGLSSYGPLGKDEKEIIFSASTVGHRFLAPKFFKVKNFNDYRSELFKAKVMLDAAERRDKIRDDAEALAKAAGLTVKADDALLEEVAGLVEWPVTLMGDIDAEFMDVPPEVLTAAMRGHQKYFSLLDADGNLAAKFIFVSNMETADGGAAIIAGNERVLRARLSDTKFFWDQDRKQGLESRLPKLAGVVFHAKLGSVLDKVERMTALAGALSSHIPKAEVETVERAAKLCKADLVTGMVAELPELQGLMGRYYALEGGENAAVADAIADHYSPAGPNDICPSKPASVALALADKIYSLVGFWAMDERPTGSKDPFALRRAALGVIRLILENKLRLSLHKVFGQAYDLYPKAYQGNAFAAPKGSVALDLVGFFGRRLIVQQKEKGTRDDLIKAVFSLKGEDDLVRVLARVDALGSFLETDDGANLLVAYKRAANILTIEEKKDGRSYDQQPYSEGKPEQAEETALLAALQGMEGKVERHLEIEDFTAAMAEMAKLRSSLDAFFDEVTVNCEDGETRAERLRMLSKIRSVMGTVADFSKIEG
jgi:glycyl-tRNA synthetase beta chain